LSGGHFIWDGANRVISFATSTQGLRGAAGSVQSSFTYDGLGRLVRIVDTQGGKTTADHSYFWCGSTRCLEHDNTQSGSPVSRQYFGQGVIASGTDYYYVTDQLGSVWQLVNASGAVQVQYAYDPYGNQATISGSAVSEIGYAGYFQHAASGLDFAMYRAYDPSYGRWLDRDPIGEAGGLNLYAYVGGNPISLADNFGLMGHAPGGIGPNNLGPVTTTVGLSFCYLPFCSNIVLFGPGESGLNANLPPLTLGVSAYVSQTRSCPAKAPQKTIENLDQFLQSVGPMDLNIGFGKSLGVSVGDSGLTLNLGLSPGAPVTISTPMTDLNNTPWFGP
jgi:RHS repeat-associated protein